MKIKSQYLKGIEFAKDLYMVDKDHLDYYKNLIDRIVINEDKKIEIYFTFNLQNSEGYQNV
ncbi:MAG: hypothetical protein ACTHWZ_08740 [Peptoniphilaceae bacterium]